MTAVLGFDTSGPYCAAALLRADDRVNSVVKEMSRGQAEHLVPMLEALLFETGTDWKDLRAIGVGTGPGNFTGLRIAVSTARGLSLGLGVPAIGISAFDARAASEPDGVRIAVPAPRDQVYVAEPDPRLVARSDLGEVRSDTPPRDQVEAIARLARDRMHETWPPPSPLYVRAPDAAPPSDQPPVILDP